MKWLLDNMKTPSLSNLHSLVEPLVIIKRYIDAKREIKSILLIDSQLEELHIQNTELLVSREALLLKMKSNGNVAEIGVADGDFSSRILELCRPNTLHLVDIWKDGRSAHGVSPIELVKRVFRSKRDTWSSINQKFKVSISENIVFLHRGLSWEKLAELPDYSLDWVYIDAAHDYESVSRDLETARTKVKEGGIIAGHDYVRWGRFGYKCGVVEAVNSFCIRHNYELLYLTVESRNNASYAIKKI